MMSRRAKHPLGLRLERNDRGLGIDEVRFHGTVLRVVLDSQVHRDGDRGEDADDDDDDEQFDEGEALFALEAGAPIVQRLVHT